MSRLYLEQGNNQEALAILEDTTAPYEAKVKPNEKNQDSDKLARIYFQKAQLLLRNGNLEEALDAIEDAIDLHNHFSFYLLKGKFIPRKEMGLKIDDHQLQRISNKISILTLTTKVISKMSLTCLKKHVLHMRKLSHLPSQ
jgi:tetratricopeptide (TPR) repeat protein